MLRLTPLRVFLLAYFVVMGPLAIAASDPAVGPSLNPHFFTLDDMDRAYLASCAPRAPHMYLHPQVKPVHHLIAGPWVAALTAAGVAPLVAHRLLMVLASAVVLAATLLLGRRFGLERWAWAAVAVAASGPFFFLLALMSVPEMLFTSFLMAGLLAHASDRPLPSRPEVVARVSGAITGPRLATLLFGLAPLVRWEGYPVAALWGLRILWNHRLGRETWIHAALLFAPSITYVGMYAAAFGDPLYVVKYQLEDVHASNLWTAPFTYRPPLELLADLGPLLYVYGPPFVVLGAVGALLASRRPEWRPLLVVVGGVMAMNLWYLFSSYKYILDRWLFPALLPLSLSAALVLRELWVRSLRSPVRWAAVGLLVLAVGANGALVASSVAPRSVALPYATHEWLASNPPPPQVYVPITSPGLFYLDRSCSILRGGHSAYVVVPPIEEHREDGCFLFAWNLSRVVHEFTWEPGSRVISPSSLRCSNLGLEPAGRIGEESWLYRVNRTVG